MRCLNSVTVPKNVIRGTHWNFLTSFVLQKNERETLCWNPTTFKKSRVVLKKSERTIKMGILCHRGSGRQCFCFRRGSGVSSIYWRSLVKIDDVEHINKNVDRLR